VLTTVAAALANNPPPELPGFLNAVGSQLNHYGYWAILLLVMLEDFGIPVPGETILIAAAIFAGAGRLNVVLVGVVGFIAAIIGDNIGFAIGHFGGRALALRWGKYVFLTEERLAKAEYFFDRQGGKIIVVARFIEGLRQANGIIAGISGMHWRRFVVFNALGAALWVGTWVTLGYVAGNHIGTIYHYITQYSLYALIAAAVLVATFIVWHLLRRRRARRGPAREVQAKVELPEDVGINEGSETIDQHGTQEAVAAENSAGIQDGGEGPASPEAKAGPEAQAGSEARAGPEAQAGPEAKAGAEAPGSVETPAGPETVGSADATESAKTKNGAEVPESAKTKSS
jgi:membrane protein DedA with SNARE-associated domain